MTRTKTSRQRHLRALGAVFAAATLPQPASADPPVKIVLSAAPIALPDDPVVREGLGKLRPRGAIELKMGSSSAAGQDFWGYSGLWVSPDGRKVAGVNFDNWMTGTLIYDAKGNLSGLRDVRTGQLLDETGKPFTNEDDKDAEALDFDGKRFLVGFERHDRVLAYSSFTSPAEKIALPPAALANIPYNMGFSSVAALPRGGMIALPEGTSDPGQPGTRAWLVRGKQQGPVWLRRSNGLPVSLAVFPGGDLLVLELIPAKGGTATRLSRIAAAEVRIGNVMSANEIAIVAPPVVGSRIEGSSIRRGRKGEILIYLMASDKRSPLYMFELPEVIGPDSLNLK